MERAILRRLRSPPGASKEGDAMTPRSLVGMTMGARKRRARAVTYVALNEVTFVETAEALAAPTHCARFHARKFPRHEYDLQMYKFLRLRYRIGQRLRPCPGCPSCTDSPRLQVIGYARRIGGRVRIDRTLDVSGRSAFYVIMFSWRHEGPMQKLRGFETKQLAWEHLQEYWGYRGHLPRLCDGSGVLTARAKKVMR